MNAKHLVKIKNKIIGFVGENSDGYYFAFDTPSQIGGYIAFRCESLQQGIDKIHEYKCS